MLKLFDRLHEKLTDSDLAPTHPVGDIPPELVSLDLDVTGWLPSSAESDAVPSTLDQVVDRRLAIAHLGLAELRRHLRTGRSEDAQVILDKLDEDLYLLRQRMRRRGETPARGPTVHGEDGPCR